MSGAHDLRKRYLHDEYGTVLVADMDLTKDEAWVPVWCPYREVMVPQWKVIQLARIRMAAGKPPRDDIVRKRRGRSR